MGRALLRLAFVAYIVATAVHIGFCVLHEPFAFDAWNMAADTRGEPFTVGRFFDYGVYEYTHSNPRLGQWFAYLSYKLEYVAVIATPLVFLATALAVFVLGAARWPSWKRGKDLALYAVILGFLWFCVPRIGMLMFCRAYATNYLYAALIQLWFLVPLRLRPSGEGGLAAGLPYFFLGVAAGMCNEHTGPTLVVFGLGYAVWRQMQTGRRPNLAWAGGFGVVVGFAAIFFAPGQGERYEGLATKVGLLSRLAQRGFAANLDIVKELVVAASPVLVVLAVLLVIGRNDPDEQGARRRAFTFFGLALAGATLVTMTLFVSPKLGPRFYMHASLVILAGFVAIADTVLITPKRFVAVVVIALTASVYAAVRTIPMYERLDVQSKARVAALTRTPRGAVFTAEAFEQVDDSWWFLGDDFRDVRKRELITSFFDLRGVIFRGVDLEAPLGLTDVRLIPKYSITPATCLDEHGGLEMGKLKSGLDVVSLQKGFRAAVEDLRIRLGDGGSIDTLALEVGFAGAAPAAIPRASILLGRWTPDGYEGWAGAIARTTASTTRDVVLPKELLATTMRELDVLVYRVGDQVKKLGTTRTERLSYKPWGAGAYWAMVCDEYECFVIAAVRQL